MFLNPAIDSKDAGVCLRVSQSLQSLALRICTLLKVTAWMQQEVVSACFEFRGHSLMRCKVTNYPDHPGYILPTSTVPAVACSSLPTATFVLPVLNVPVSLPVARVPEWIAIFMLKAVIFK